MEKTGEAEYRFDSKFEVTDHVKADFDRYGYILVRNLLDSDELKILKEALNNENGVKKHAYNISDGSKRPITMCLWMHPGNDVTGMVARSEKVVSTSEKLLGGEVYHYHSKLMMKEPREGGSFEWHQDYGYWYKNGCHYPDMMTVFVAVDKSSKQNGCLQVIPGSHKCGRLDHGMIGGQQGADNDRVQHIINSLGVRYIEMESGDALYFHSNLLHKSNANESDIRRWALLIAFNKASNNPTDTHPLPQYTPILKVDDSAIQNCTNMTDLSGKVFLDGKEFEDKNVKVLDKRDNN